VKIGTSYQPFIQQMVGPPKEAAAKSAAGNGETSPFQQLLAIMGTNTKNEEGNVLVSRGSVSEPSKQQEDATGQMAIEEWLLFLLFIWNNMQEANQMDDSSAFPSRPIGQAVANNEAMARFIRQMDRDMLMKQVSNVINDELPSRLLSLFDSDAFVQFIKQIDKHALTEQISNVINGESSSRLYSFLDADMHPLLQNGSERKEQIIDIQTLLRETLERLNRQEEKSAKVSSNSIKTGMLQNRFLPSSPSVFSKSFDLSLGNVADAENIEKQKNSGMTLFNVSLPNGNTVVSQENAPVIVVDKKANGSFLQQLTNIIQSSRFTRFQNGNAQLVIRLYPEHLGTLTVKIMREHGMLTAKLIASTDSAKELLDANLPQLYHALSTENITVEKWNALAQDRYMPAFYQEERGHEQKERQQRKEEKAKKQSFHDEFMTEIIDTEV
jgi:flagellar hook-length control protein FliK